MCSEAFFSRSYSACRKEGITNKVLVKMTFEELRSIGLSIGNAKLVKDTIDALAPRSPAVHQGGGDAAAPASGAVAKGGGSVCIQQT